MALGEVLLRLLEVLVVKKEKAFEGETDALVDANSVRFVDVEGDLVDEVLFFLFVRFFGTQMKVVGCQTVENGHLEGDV